MANIILEDAGIYKYGKTYYDFDQVWVMKSNKTVEGYPKVHPDGYIQIGTELNHESVFFELFEPKVK